MKTGTVINTFTAKDGRRVVLRTPRWEDLDDLMESINSLVEEGADIVRDQKVARESEADWLGRQLAEIEKGNNFILVAEVDGRVVASADLTKERGYANHVGDIGIAIKNGYRDIGIGTEMLKTLISQAEVMGLMMLVLHVFSTNKRAMHVYKKVGFKETGRIINNYHRNGKFIDDITMVKELTSASTFL